VVRFGLRNSTVDNVKITYELPIKSLNAPIFGVSSGGIVG